GRVDAPAAGGDVDVGLEVVAGDRLDDDARLGVAREFGDGGGHGDDAGAEQAAAGQALGEVTQATGGGDGPAEAQAEGVVLGDRGVDDGLDVALGEHGVGDLVEAALAKRGGEQLKPPGAVEDLNVGEGATR